MKKLLTGLLLATALTGCASLQSAQTQQNLILATKFSCIFEPTVTGVVGIFDERKGTLINIDKVDKATRKFCEALLVNK